ncbi:MAG: leucyl aminopeptidase, partial [Bacteroidota bacterium]
YLLPGKETAVLKMYGFSVPEINYLKKQFSGKKETVKINRLGLWQIIISFKSGSKGPDVLEKLRKAGCDTVSFMNREKIDRAGFTDLSGCSDMAKAFIEGFVLGNYSFQKYFTDKEKTKNTVAELGVLSEYVSSGEAGIIKTVCDAVYKARDLVNEPGNMLTAQKLAGEIVEMGKTSGYHTEVFGKKKIESMKMGGILAVNKGSIQPPTFSVLTWKPEYAVNRKPVVLVGKGVVFDTGGINLKPGKSLEGMKADMAGAAAVAGCMYILASLKVPVYVIALVPATDNRPAQDAYVPHDVIFMHDGSTVEVMNTDAEGRLLLADALSYAKKYKPELVVDIATLTGSAHAAVGHFAAVAMGNASGKWFAKLKKSSEKVHERIVEFPFWDDYKELLKSDVADMKNVGGAHAGAITAGKFLEHFTDYPYIHIDIAGPGYLTKTDSYRGKGGTGTGVRLLADFIMNLY